MGPPKLRLLTGALGSGKFALAMEAFWNWVDRAWVKMASVKLTLVILISLLLLSIPGTLILQINMSSVDPALQYSYDFWKFGMLTQLFTAYHSFWYVGAIVILSINLIACSVERWPQMWKMATAKPVAWAKETFERQPKNLLHEWKVSAPKDMKAYQQKIFAEIRKSIPSAQITETSDSGFQIFFQTGRWSRIANYLVHMSLLVIFAGAIVTALYGFEGAANIPAGSAVDTFIVFKEGKAAELKPAPGGQINEKLLGFRLAATEFKVDFYEDFPGRPKDFVSDLQVFENGESVLRKTVRVNDPLEYKKFSFYQASYGRLGDFDIKFRVIGKKEPEKNIYYIRSNLGQIQDVSNLKINVVPIFATMDLRGLGPAVQFTEVKDGKPLGTPFWVLKAIPEFDFRDERAQVPWGIVVDDVKELYFTGLQIGYDPGAPIYWFGCAGLLLGTFYALFVTHKKYYLRFEKGHFYFTGTIHRLPSGFDAKVSNWAYRIQRISEMKHHS